MDFEEGKYLNDFDNKENLIEGNKTIKTIFLFILIIFLIVSLLKNTKKNNSDKNNDNDLLTLDNISSEELNNARSQFKQYIYEDSIDSSKLLPYNFYAPQKYSNIKKYPLVVFISDARMVGKDVTAPLNQTVGGPIWATEIFQKKHKCFVLVPTYNEIFIDDKNGYFINEYINVTVRLISLIKSKYPIDSNRIYGTGQSLGAMAILYLLANYPNLFTAGLVIGGQWKINELYGLINSTFTYIVSVGDENAFNGQNEVKNYIYSNNIKFGSISNIDAQEKSDLLDIYTKNMYNLGYRHNFINFAQGSVLSPDTKNKNEHLASFKYGYRIEAVREWLFSQKINTFEEFYKSNDGRIISTNFCDKSNKDNLCIKCINGFYLSKDKMSCTKEINCVTGDKKTGLCNWCIDNYYLDLKDRKCKPYSEKEDIKYCKILNEGICSECDKYYYLTRDNKCSISANCSKSKNTLCLKCLEGFHLGLDKKCIDVKRCIYSKNNECIECEDGYYYNRVNRTCKKAIGNFTNCKSNSYYSKKKCAICKDNYYLSLYDYLCYDNTKKGPFYKCQISNSNGKLCQVCIKDYFIGRLDSRCNKVEGCFRSQNENKCLECGDFYCLDNNGKCINNYYVISEDKKYYYRCKKLNEKGNSCMTCENELKVNKEGVCFDDIHCEEKDDKGFCKKCKKDNPNGYYSYCLNRDFGCIDSFHKNCIRCDDILNLDICTECEEGFKIDKEGRCIKIK